MEKLKIALVSTERLFAESLQTFINSNTDDMQITDIIHNNKEIISIASRIKPSIILIDTNISIIESVKEILLLLPQVKIVILSNSYEYGLVHSALLKGAQGFLSKDISPNDLITAIRGVKNGIVQLSERALLNLICENKERKTIQNERTNIEKYPFEYFRHLTKREYDVFVLIAEGYNNKEIELQLNLAEQTVRNHVSTIYAKLGVKDRLEIIKPSNRFT